jgi:N-acetylmuramoyl-L-alanine amidase
MDLYELTGELEELSEAPGLDLQVAAPTRPAWIDWRPSPHHSSRRGRRVAAIVYHYTAGPTQAGTVSWFQNPQSRVSAHYVIGRNGRIVQMVRLNRAAWHAGRSILAGRRGVNRFSIGIEIVNWGQLRRRGQRYRRRGVRRRCAHPFCTRTGRRYTGQAPIRARGRYWEPYTQAQYRSLIRLTRYLVARYPTITHITGHEDIALPRGRKTDPGGAFDWARIRAALGHSFRGRIGRLPRRRP